MATRNAPREDPEVIILGDFEVHIIRIRIEVLKIFEDLHSSLDERKEVLLGELNRLIAINERNRDAEQAIRQLEAALESISVTISSNLLQNKKDHYTASIRADITECMSKVIDTGQVEAMRVAFSNDKFSDAMQSIHLSANPVQSVITANFRVLRDGGNLKRPRGVAVCNDDIFIADRYSNCVKVFSMHRGFSRVIGGDRNQLNNPWGVAVYEDAVYVTDAGKSQVSKFRISGELVRKSGFKGAREGEFMNARGLFVNQDAVYVCDQGNNRVQVLTHNLVFSSVISHIQLTSPVDVFVKGKEIIVLLLTENKVILFSIQGQLLRTVRLDAEHAMRESYFFTVSTGGYLVSSRLEGCIKSFSLEGRFEREVGRGYANDCYGVSIIGDGEGIVCVANASEQGCIQIYTEK